MGRDDMTDTIRAAATYIIAAVVVIGGMAYLFATRLDTAGADTRVVIAGFIGSALTFVFGSEVQTRTARQSAAATLAGTVGAANGPDGEAVG